MERDYAKAGAKEPVRFLHEAVMSIAEIQRTIKQHVESRQATDGE